MWFWKVILWRATAGFEPATHSLGNYRSILLSYGRTVWFILAWEAWNMQRRHFVYIYVRKLINKYMNEHETSRRLTQKMVI